MLEQKEEGKAGANGEGNDTEERRPDEARLVAIVVG